jgi:large subunit ribosomal protein L5e
MPFVKVVKSKAYFKRFQVKYRRRREGKTDYRARKRLITQDKNKYNSPKYRLVVRFTNTDVIAQIAYATIEGDKILAAAYSHELPRYGMAAGLTNYAASYATGLLLARRLLKTLNLADKYQGNKEINGQDYNVEALADGPNPFTALLDVGLHRTTTGSKLFAVLKGAADGGIEVPHSERRFVGYDAEQKKFDPEVLRKHIFGTHVAEYMKSLKEENPTKYERTFSRYIKANIKADDLEKLWAKVHAAIRASPEAKKSEKKKPEGVQKRFKKTKLSYEQRKDRIRQKAATRAKKAQQQSV